MGLESLPTGTTHGASKLPSYAIYRLPLAGGGIVRARKLDRTALLASGLLSLPLLGLAVDAARGGDDAPEKKRNETFKYVSELCRAALIDPTPDPDELDLTDRLMLYQWATTLDAIGGATIESHREWKAEDFRPLIQSEVAVTLDMLCRRYNIRPSEAAGLSGAIAIELDLAMAYRGAAYETKVKRGEQEIEVEDAYGNMVKVPASWFPDESNGGSVTHADDMARTAARMGLKEMAMSAGGAIGQAKAMAIGPMGRFGNRPIPQ